jgi:hypothetical protein
MDSTALLPSLSSLTQEQHDHLGAEAALLSLHQVFGAVPDPHSSHGLRCDLPFLLTCPGCRDARPLQSSRSNRSMVLRPPEAVAAFIRTTTLGLSHQSALSLVASPIGCLRF